MGRENSAFMISSEPNYLPKVPPPNTVMLEVRASIYEFRGDTNIQSFDSPQPAVVVIMMLMRKRKMIVGPVTKTSEFGGHIKVTCKTLTPQVHGQFLIF